MTTRPTPSLPSPGAHRLGSTRPSSFSSQVVIAIVVAFLLVATACGGSDDAGTAGSSAADSSPSTAGADSPGSEESPDSPPIAAADGVVVVEASDPSAGGDYVRGQRVEIGTPALVGPVQLIVESITAGEPVDGSPTVNVSVIFSNEHSGAVTGPDFSVVCADDGRVGLPTDLGTVQSLVTLEAGAAVGGAVSLSVPADCDEALLQVRVLPVVLGNDPIAEYLIPETARS